MLKRLVDHLDRAAVTTGGLASLADRVGARLLPQSVAEAASTSSCVAYACSCFAGGGNCNMQMFCPGVGMVCGEFCGICTDPP